MAAIVFRSRANKIVNTNKSQIHTKKRKWMLVINEINDIHQRLEALNADNKVIIKLYLYRQNRN